MPSLPKWLGDSVETIFSGSIHPLTVTQASNLDTCLKKVRLEGDLSATKFTAGNVVEFRINDTDYRHYTPSFYDAENGVCEILFYLHDKGPGSRWAHTLKAGDHCKLIGPGGKIRYRPDFQYHFLFGDETSLSLFHAMKKDTMERGHEYFCLYESDREHKHWAELAGISAEWAAASPDAPAKNAVGLLEEIIKEEKSCWNTWHQAFFYLTGRAKSIQTFRKMLNQAGISNATIQTEPYWADGKTGL